MAYQIISIVILIISIIIHEVAHGWIADRFGDPTPRAHGRLTANPIPHIDPIGSLLVPGLLLLSGAHFFIGWAKPVPINPQYFKNPERGMMWVALAGPLSNITLMTIGIIAVRTMLAGQSIAGPSEIQSLVMSVLLITVQVNLILAVFNLIPIPPLDGSRILANFLPVAAREAMYRYETYGMILIIVAASLGWFSPLFRLVFAGLQWVLLL